MTAFRSLSPTIMNVWSPQQSSLREECKTARCLAEWSCFLGCVLGHWPSWDCKISSMFLIYSDGLRVKTSKSTWKQLVAFDGQTDVSTAIILLYVSSIFGLVTHDHFSKVLLLEKTSWFKITHPGSWLTRCQKDQNSTFLVVDAGAETVEEGVQGVGIGLWMVVGGPVHSSFWSSSLWRNFISRIGNLTPFLQMGKTQFCRGLCLPKVLIFGSDVFTHSRETLPTSNSN